MAKMFILNQVAGNIHNSLFEFPPRDNVSEPYFHLQRVFAERGFDFAGVAEQPISEAACLIFWDYSSVRPRSFLRRPRWYLRQLRAKASTRDLLTEAEVAGSDVLKVLILFEPPSVDPGNADKRNHAPFDLVFTWDPRLIDGKRYRRVVLPSPREFKSPAVPLPFAERKLLVDISGYHFNYHPRALSNFRKQEVRYFQRHYPSQFDLFGQDWNLPLSKFLKRKVRDWRLPYEHFPAYRGTVRHKWDILPNYKFSLVYENIADEPGFVSVKIFDCLRSGCVPVYRGACNIDEYVDADAFVDRRMFPSTEELARFLESMDERTYSGYLQAAERYLASPKFEQFLSDSFSREIVEPILEKLTERCKGHDRAPRS